MESKTKFIILKGVLYKVLNTKVIFLNEISRVHKTLNCLNFHVLLMKKKNEEKTTIISLLEMFKAE